MNSWIRIVAGVGLLALGMACASPSPPRLPPLTATPSQLATPGKFVWVDLVSGDVEASKSFYGELFGWTFREGERYTEVLRDGAPIAGLLSTQEPGRRSEWVGSLSVPDVDRAAALVEERGGKIEREPVDASERGRLALVRDPEGALVMLLRASGGDPPDAEPPVGAWLWRELWSRDVKAATEFYVALAGYGVEVIEHDGHPYHVLETGDVPRAGVFTAPEEVRPQWLPYVRVNDPKGMAERAADLGGRIVMYDDTAAVLVDPVGAPVGLQVWPLPEGEGTR